MRRPVRATLIVPTLNESESIGHVLRTFREAAESANPQWFPHDPLEWEILVVDGSSTDGTPDLARAEGARVVNEPRKGYGQAYKTGFAAAWGEVIATADGDATYPVEEIPQLVRRLLDAKLDFISCNRLAYLDRTAMTTEHRIGNRVLNLFVAILYHRFLRSAAGGELRDSQSGMWVFRREVLERVRPSDDGMPFSEELKLDILIEGLRFEEVPIHYAERWGAPKLSSWQDGRKNLTFLIRKRFALAREIQRKRAGAPAPANDAAAR
ncbi:MAG: glycosyltransferase family 2 protein [Thermoplasmata archaeon]